MRVKRFGLAALFAVMGAAVAIGAAPIAVSDECNPVASICQGPDVQDAGSSPSFAPAPVDTGGAPSEQQLTEDNQGIVSPGFEGGGGHR